MASGLSHLKLHSDSAVCCACSDSDELVCSGSLDCSLMLWRITDGWTKRLRGHTNWVLCCAFQPGGAMLASGSADETIRLWNLEAILADIPEEETGYQSVELKVYGSAVRCCCFSASGALLCSGSADKLVRIWDVEKGECVRTLAGHKHFVLSAAFHPLIETSLVTTSSDGTIRVWKVDEGASVMHLKGKKTLAGRKEVTCCAFHPDGETFCTGGEDKVLRVWRVADGECVRELRGHKGVVQGCSFQGGSGRVLASVEGNTVFGSDNGVRLWDTESYLKDPVAVLKGHKKRVNACAFNAAGSTLVTVGNDNTARLWLLSDAFLSAEPPARRPPPAKAPESCARRSSEAESAAGRQGGAEGRGEEAGGAGAGAEGEREGEMAGAGVGMQGRRQAGSEEVGGGVWGGDGEEGLASEASTSSYGAGRDAERGGERGRDWEREREAAVRGGHRGGVEGSTERGGVEEEDEEEGQRGETGGPTRRASNSSEEGGGDAGGRDTVGREWVQVRLPMRVDARLMQMAEASSANERISQAEVGSLGVNPSQTLSNVVDEDGLPLFSVTADFGRVAIAPKPIEPRSTGIDMTRLDEHGAPVPKPPPSAPLPQLTGLHAKQWRGRLGPEASARGPS